MERVTAVPELRERVRRARREGAVVGVVPTMGAFHEGHLSLMRRARAECGLVVVTLFVNPAQFGPAEDFSRYPRDLDADGAMAATAGADLLFAPPVEAVYPKGFSTVVEVEGPLVTTLEGASRPTHFRGVTTVVAKLLNMTRPDRAYFGQKDFQQLQVVRRMVRDLDLPVEVVPCPTVREPDGLAMSSRNRYLAPDERRAAGTLSRGLAAARERFQAGERTAAVLVETARALLRSEPLVRPDYLELVDVEEWKPVETVKAPAVLAVAARVGTTRLIDNTVFDPEGPE